MNLEDIRQRLMPVTETPYLDAQVLLSHILDRPRSTLLAHPDLTLTPLQNKAVEEALQQLERGVPLPYVLGSWEFYNLEFSLTQDVLIPRPETELLVDYALEWLQEQPGNQRCADIGTGSGCIAVSIAYHHREIKFIGNDIHLDSVKVAKKNIERHNLGSQISLYQGYLMQALQGQFDLLVSNLPYLPTENLVSLPVYKREPSRALDGGEDGLKFITELLASAPQKIADKGLLLLEIDESQGEQAARLSKEAFPGASVAIKKDLAGHDRMVVIHTNPS